MPDWLGTLLSVMAGGGLTMASNWFADQRLSDREREQRREERNERLILRRNDFQRETLLALQVASQKLLRNTGAIFHQDILAYRKGLEWRRQKLPDNLSDEDLRLRTETMLLASRVRDPTVRDLADSLCRQSVDVEFSSGESEADSRMKQAAATQGELVQRIGQLVRELDEEKGMRM